MAQAPDGDETLTPDDAGKILEELLDAMNHAKLLGLMLNIKPRDVEAILNKYKDPKEQLLHIILAFLQQAELRPTWRAIIEALRSSVVDLTALAKKVESNHFPDLTASREAGTETSAPDEDEDEVKSKQFPSQCKSSPNNSHPDPPASRELVPQTTDGVCPAKATAPKDEDEVKSKQTTTSQLTPATNTSGKELCVSSTSEEIKESISKLEDMFDHLKEDIRECLEKKGVLVRKLADVLTSISADEDDQHKMFLKDHITVLFRAANISELFGTMNFHWNYLNPPLLDHLVRKFKLEEVKGEMESYKSDLQHFRKQTPLAEFCRTQKRRRMSLKPEFREMVAEFDWPKDATLMLEVVEQFRQEYASQYNLRDCAMMIAEIRPGSYIITWSIPESIVKVLKAKSAKAVLKKFSVTRLDIDGVCVYRSRKPLENIPVASGGPVDGATTGTTKPKPAPSQAKPLPEDDYLYVEQPSKDFFCPVMMGLLLQPHLTSCCGNHLSQEAANRIQGERGACPLCKEKQWSTVLDKHYQRQVNSLRVFCRHEERGCGWQGELGTYQSHVESCPMAEGPLMTELAELPVYKEEVRFSAIRRTSIPTASSSKPVYKEEVRVSGAERTSTPAASSSKNQMTVQCRIKGKAPVEMSRGSAISDGRYAYFLSNYYSSQIFRFEYNTEKWKRLPPCPYRNSGLTIINGELTTVGGELRGELRGEFSNKLMSLRGSNWSEGYPPMKIARSSPTVVATDDGIYHIVIGGLHKDIYTSERQWTTFIEIFDARDKERYTTKLPAHLQYPSATISGNQWYVLGRLSDKSEVGFSLQVRKSSDDQIIKSPLSLSPWKPLPPLPVDRPTPAILSGQLVLVGGGDMWRSESSIYQLLDGEWVEIGSTNSERYDCFAVRQSHDKIIIVGGYKGRNTLSNDIEECTVIH